ncbi:MAG: PEP-CTERM sorting domain-containing protein [Mariniblastus sp.]|nr:PEP-CTERM sorting domain-containing protein [Mariniblastus sp.]
MKIALPIAVAAVLFVSTLASADIVTTYTYDFSSGPEDASPGFASNSNPYATLSGFNTIASTEDQAGTLPKNSGIKQEAAWVNCEIMGSTSGIVGDCYQEFSISAANWTDQISLNRLQFDLGNFGLQGPVTIGGWLQIDVHASTDGFATEDVSLGSLRITQTTFSSPSGSFDESFTGEFQNVKNKTLDFRFIATSNIDDNGIETRLDNIQLTITSVPEPGSALLLSGVALLGLIRRRR